MRPSNLLRKARLSRVAHQVCADAMNSQLRGKEEIEVDPVEAGECLELQCLDADFTGFALAEPSLRLPEAACGLDLR